ncbi:MAG: hypothetical protein AAFV95_09025 [Bacteroidota bacterium]
MPAEIHRLDKFLRSPYFNDIKQKARVLQLFEQLSIHLKDKSDPPEKAALYEHLFPEDRFSNAKMDKLMARLLRLVKRFIAVEQAELREQEFNTLLQQTRFYRKRGLQKYFWQNIRQLQEQFGENEMLLSDFLINREITEMLGPKSERREDLNLPDTLQSLDQFYILNKLKYANWILVQHFMHVPIPLRDSLQLLDQMLPSIEQNLSHKHPLIKANVLAYRLLGDRENEDIYRQLEHCLQQHQANFPEDSRKDLQSICRSFCIRQSNRGNLAYVEKVFALYKSQLEEGHLYHQNGLLAASLKNIVTYGLRSRAFEWVRQVLADHQHRIIGTEFPQSVYQYNLANYHFALKEYEQALQHLGDYPMDTYYKIAYKRMELKIYYELNSPLLASRIDSLKVYLFRISRHLLPDTPKAANNHFVNLLRQICNPTTLQNGKRIDKIKAKIQINQPVAERGWLLEKLEELR